MKYNQDLIRSELEHLPYSANPLTSPLIPPLFRVLYLLLFKYTYFVPTRILFHNFHETEGYRNSNIVVLKFKQDNFVRYKNYTTFVE